MYTKCNIPSWLDVREENIAVSKRFLYTVFQIGQIGLQERCNIPFKRIN